MAIQFPSSPADGEIYNDPSSGLSFIYDLGTESWDPYNIATFVNSSYFTSTLSNYALLSGASFTGNVTIDTKIGINVASPAYSISTNKSDAFQVPQGNTGQRPSANAGLIRYNSQLGDYEVSDGNTWFGILKPTEIALGNGIINETEYSGTANNSTYFDGRPSADYTLDEELADILMDYAKTSDLSANLTVFPTKAGDETITGSYTFEGNVAFSNSVLIANGSFGTSNQALLSNGSSMYWGDLPSSGFTNGQSISVNNFTITGAFTANSSNGTAGQVLASNGTSVYWTNPAAGVNTDYQYTFTNTITFSQTINGTANIALTANNASYLNGNSAADLQTYADNKAGNAYSNATSYSSNADHLSSGTVAEARLPYRMNQNVRTTDTVEFSGLTLTGNLVVSGNVNIVGANNLSISDNMIYLNSNNDVSNPDLGFAGNYNDGSYHHAGFFRDATDGVWKVFDNYAPEPDASAFIDTSNNTFHIADFQANQIFVGNTSVYSTINTTSFSGTANNATYSYGKAESNLNVNSALTSNNSTYAYGKTEGALSVNNALYLDGTAAAVYVKNTDSRTLSGNLTFAANITVNGLISNGSIGTAGQVLKSNGSATYWGTDSADVGAAGQVLFRNSSNVLTTSSGLQYDGVSLKVNGNLESVYQNGSEGGEIFLSKPASGTTLSGTGVTLDIFENKLRIFENGGTNRGAYIDLTAATGGVGTNLLSGGGGGGSVNTSAQFTWTNTHIFQANVAFTGNNISVVSNTGSVLFGGAGDTNWRIGRSTGSFTKSFYTNNTLDFIAANSNLEGIAFGFTGNSVYLETGYAGTFTKNPIYIGNSSVNASINSTTFSGTANNAINLDGKAEGTLNVNSALTANNSTNLGGTAAASYVQNTDSRTLSGNLVFSAANVAFTGNVRVNGFIANGSLGTAGQVLASNGTAVYWTTDQNSGNLTASYIQITTGTLTVGNSTVNTDIGNNYVSVGNSTSYANIYSTYIRIGNSSVQSTINSTAFTGSANNASNLGGVAAASYVQNTDSRTLSGNLVFSAANVAITGNIRIKGLIANNSLGTAGQVLASNGTAVYWTSDQGANAITANSLIANSIAITTGTLTVGNSTVNTDIGNNYISVGNTISFVNIYSTYIYFGNTTANATVNSTVYTGTANNASYLGGTLAANYVQNTDSRTLSGNLNFSGANTNIAGNLTIASTGELIITNGAGIYANGSLGTTGQVLTTNGSSVYWSTASGGGFSNGQSISVNNFVITGGFTANSSNGTAGQVLTSNGSGAYWANAGSTTANSQTFTGNGTNTVFTLAESISDQDAIFVMLDGLVQTPNTNYTASGTTLTFDSAPTDNTSIEVRYINASSTGGGGGGGGASANIVFGYNILFGG